MRAMRTSFGSSSTGPPGGVPMMTVVPPSIGLGGRTTAAGWSTSRGSPATRLRRNDRVDAERMPALHALSLFVRWAHVAGMAAILGGALLVWVLGTRRARANAGVVVGVADRYEWIFWAAIGLQVMTGVGNLGAFGDALP